MKIKDKINTIYFFIIGLGALLWFLIRVIPKPSRASYPCMKAAFPLASTFIIYITGLASSIFLFKKAKGFYSNSRVIVSSVFFALAVIFGFSTLLITDQSIYATNYRNTTEQANEPVGTGKGIFPGRVVWVYELSAVDQQCSNSDGDLWWEDENNDQAEINKMVSDAIRNLSGKTTDAEAWDAIFRNFNKSRGRGDVGYTAGEKIVIKINLNNGVSGNSYERPLSDIVDTSPQVVFAVLDQLINKAGIAQADIGFGDPGRNVDNIFWDKFHSTFPDVKYWGIANGRTPILPSVNPVFMNSDGEQNNYLPQCYLDATYMINIPVLKQHHRGGISLTSKNHFGSFVPFLGNAFPLHYSLPCTNGDRIVDNGDYGVYRIFVDFIGHKDLGGKTVLYLIDGLWSSTNWGDPAWKWRMPPFNNSYPASIFASQDPVAIESVGFDFLVDEFKVGNPSGNDFPSYSGVDDFLHQAADSSNWPADIKYDPEADGTLLPGSMGVHEHWNNPVDKQYSRNLNTGPGIELVKISSTTGINDGSSIKPKTILLNNNYPNPFNPSTTISYSIPSLSKVDLSVFDISGKEITILVNASQEEGWYTTKFDAARLSSGIYTYRLKVIPLVNNKNIELNESVLSKKMILMK